MHQLLIMARGGLGLDIRSIAFIYLLNFKSESSLKSIECTRLTLCYSNIPPEFIQRSSCDHSETRQGSGNKLPQSHGPCGDSSIVPLQSS